MIQKKQKQIPEAVQVILASLKDFTDLLADPKVSEDKKLFCFNFNIFFRILNQ